MSEGLPKGWVEVTLNDIADWSSGGTPKATEPKYYNGSIPWLIIADLNNSIVTKSAKKISQIGLENSSAKWVDIGSILIAMYGSIGKLGIAGIRCTTNQAIAFTTNIWGQIPNMYLFYYLKYNEPELLNVGQGGAQKNISQTILKEYPFPLPPLNEQKRIVAKLDVIMPRVEAVKARLDKVPGILKRFRQSVLTAAITGKLTEQWREEHPEVESAEKVIEQLFKRRTQRFSSPVQKQKIEEVYTKSESEDESIIPDTWKYTFLNKICDSFQYGTSAKSEKEGKVVVLRMGNLQNGKIDWSDLAYTSDDKEIEKYLLKKDDVLFNRTNSPELVGKTSIYTGEKKAIFAGYLIRINNYRDVLDSHYLNFALNTGYAREFCHREKTDGVNQSNINAQKLAHFEISLPPLEEQKEIVRQVDKLFALADKVEFHYQKAKARVDKLSQSILAKAFCGELVPQDPNDEPAAKLLEMIQEERERLSQGTRRIRRKKK